MKPRHFTTAADFRRWLEMNHATATELWVAFYKKGSGKTGLTYSDAVDEALCFGWIDGIIKRLDAERFMHRFSPRQPRSTWSNLNVRKVEHLTVAGRMHAAGLAAFAARMPARTGIYSFESDGITKLTDALEREFRSDRKAWEFFCAQPPSYRRMMIHMIMSAKRDATRARRLARVRAESAAGRRLDPMAPLKVNTATE